MRWWWLEKIPSIHLWLPDTLAHMCLHIHMCLHTHKYAHIPAMIRTWSMKLNTGHGSHSYESPWKQGGLQVHFLQIFAIDSGGCFSAHLCCAGTEHAPLFLSSSSFWFSGPEARVYTLQPFWFLIISSNGKKRKENEFLVFTWFWHYEKLTSEGGQTASPRYFLFITSIE